MLIDAESKKKEIEMYRTLKLHFTSILTLMSFFWGTSTAMAISFSFDSYTGAIATQFTSYVSTSPSTPYITPIYYSEMNGVLFNASDIDETLGTSVLHYPDEEYDGIVYSDSEEVFRGIRMFEAGTTKIDFGWNMLEFFPASNSDYAIGEEFLLGTLTFTNESWSVDPEGAAFDFTIIASSATAGLTDQVFAGTLIMQTNSNSLSTPEERADWLYIDSRPDLGSLRVYESIEDGLDNTGSIEFWGQFGSLELVELRNPTGGGFHDDSITSDLSTPVPEPASMLLFGAGLAGLVGARLRKKKK